MARARDPAERSQATPLFGRMTRSWPIRSWYRLSAGKRERTQAAASRAEIDLVALSRSEPTSERCLAASSSTDDDADQQQRLWQLCVPAEVLTNVFLCLTPGKETNAVLRVCRRWRDTVSSPYFWRRMHALHYGGPKLAGAVDWKASCEQIERTLRATTLAPGKRLLWAAQHGHHVVVERLLAERWSGIGRLSSSDSDNNSSMNYSEIGLQALPSRVLSLALLLACQAGHGNVIERLLQHRSSLNLSVQNDHGATPLWLATKLGNTHIVRQLLDAGSNVNKQRDSGGSPLFIASEAGHTELVELLLRAKADPRVPRTDGATPLHIVRSCSLFGVVWCCLVLPVPRRCRCGPLLARSNWHEALLSNTNRPAKTVMPPWSSACWLPTPPLMRLIKTATLLCTFLVKTDTSNACDICWPQERRSIGAVSMAIRRCLSQARSAMLPSYRFSSMPEPM